jgi:predicted Zn finger-like uncharacterized protein
MIVRCPECSTGFKLPDEQVTEKGVKLRCSKCSHVFRIRLAEDGDTEFFYNDGDREQNRALAASADQDSADQDSDADTGSEEQDSAEVENEWDEGESTQLGKPLAAAGAPKDADVAAEEGNKTHFGMPSSKNKEKEKEASEDARKPSKSASSNYNPFPHANLGGKSSDDSATNDSATSDSATSDSATSDSATSDSEPAPSEDPQPAQPEANASPQEEDLAWGDEATRIDEDAFGGAFDDEPEEEDPFGDAFADDDASEAPVATQAPPAQAPPAQAPPAQAPPAQAPPSAAAPIAAAQAAAAGAQAGAQPAAQAQGPHADQDSDFWAQQNSDYRPEEMVDPSFGQDGPAFDPEQGVVDNKPAPKKPTESKPAAGPPAGVTASPTSAPAAQSKPAQSKPAQSKPAQSKPAQSKPAQSEQRLTTQNDGGWKVDMVDEPIAPHTVGGSGVQKFANLMLIALIVGVGFLAVVAGLSGGILDLERFPHMIEVAFDGAEFEPRAEWVKQAAPAPAPAPENPVRFEGVFAVPAQAGKSDQVVLVRGKAKNIANVDYSDVVVRGIVYDENERPIGQTTAMLGARVLQSQIVEAGSVDAANALLPDSAKLLSSKASEPFSLIFTDLPPKVFEGQNVSYKVEIADKKTVGDEGATAASN